MSGPTVVIVPVPPEPSLLLMTATALLAAELVRRAAQAVVNAEAEAADLRQTHAQQLNAEQLRQTQAEAAGQQALRQELDATRQRWAELCALAQTTGQPVAAALPEAPAPGAAPEVVAAHVRAAQSLCNQLAALLETQFAALPAAREQAARLADIASPAQADLAAQLATYAQRQAPELLHAVQRALGRVAHLPWPQELERLVQQLAQPLTPERAQALLLELRRQVQALQEAEIARAQAIVLAHTLKDLGYELEEVGETLFAQGGVLHLRKPGWGDYLVRMRVNAQQRTANFNVLRAVDSTQNERSVLDHLAEDRWCAEFPALLAALEARGLPLQVARRLEAGELPVQQVLRSQLPRFASQATQAEQAEQAAQEASSAARAPMQRHLP